MMKTFRLLLAVSIAAIFSVTALAQDNLLIRYNGEAVTEEEPEAETIQTTAHGKYGFGFYIGYSGEVFNGHMTSYLGASHGISFGFDIFWKRLFLDVDFSVGWAGKLRKGGFYGSRDYEWLEGDRITVANLNGLVGYRILDTRYLALSPIVGFGVGNLSQNIGYDYDYDEEISSDLSGFRKIAGVQANLKLLKHDGYEQSLAVRVYWASTSFRYPCPANSINIGVVYDLMGRWNN